MIYASIYTYMHLYIYMYIYIYVYYIIYICVLYMAGPYTSLFCGSAPPRIPHGISSSHRSSTAKHQVLHGFIVGGMLNGQASSASWLHRRGNASVWNKMVQIPWAHRVKYHEVTWSSWSAKSCGKPKSLNHLDPFGMIFTTQLWQSYKIFLKAPPPAAFRVGVVGVSSSQHPAAKRERSLWGFNRHNSFTEKTLPSYATAKKHTVLLVS